MEKVILQATHRTVTGKQVGVLRREGKLPAGMYGHKLPPTPILLDLHTTTRTLMGITPSSIITIELDGKKHAVLVREKQRNVITGTLLHIDFQVVSLTEVIRTKVSIEITGTAPAIKDNNGILVTGVDQIEVESLPQDLPEKMVVDTSGLANIGDGIYVRDLVAPQKVTILSNPEEMIVIITGQMIEEEVEVEEEVAGEEEPEVIERGKKEEEFSD